MRTKQIVTSVTRRAFAQHFELRITNRHLTLTGRNTSPSEAPDPPESNQPDSIAKEARTDTPSTDDSSNASQHEHKSRDDHPAKQPDPQAEPTRHTGFGGKSKVQGGEEGLKERSDK